MPLTINLKPREKLILNGVVIENSGPMAKILIHTNAALLREKDVLPEEKATTPARRIYFAIQCQYLFAGKADLFFATIDQQLKAYAEAQPESRGMLAEIRRLLAEDQFYRALKTAKLLIQNEEEAAACGVPAPAGKPPAG
ncbi:MAG: flagellar biosynthesis repressor FlbT [Alphaproteobacteria bacterium]|nr:flagellar biosynthesis repressor FlbT [Alphaproteobacteria bacterium]